MCHGFIFIACSKVFFHLYVSELGLKEDRRCAQGCKAEKRQTRCELRLLSPGPRSSPPLLLSSPFLPFLLPSLPSLSGVLDPFLVPVCLMNIDDLDGCIERMGLLRLCCRMKSTPVVCSCPWQRTLGSDADWAGTSCPSAGSL